MQLKFITLLLILFSLHCNPQVKRLKPILTSSNGLRMMVVDRDFPLLKILIPGEPESDRGIEIEFPEHVTGLNKNTGQSEHLYLASRRNRGSQPIWEFGQDSIQYKKTVGKGVSMTATAKLETDGLRISYRFINSSSVSYEKLQAVTCVKQYSLFSDTLLERTYVHHAEGFDLMASETPERLSMAIQYWLPCRYLVSYMWPVSPVRVEKDADSITRYYKARKADKPFIATLSHDHLWVTATYTRETGNLWTNPERSCQHADPAILLPAGGSGRLDLKVFIIKGNLEQLLERVNNEMEIR